MRFLEVKGQLREEVPKRGTEAYILSGVVKIVFV